MTASPSPSAPPRSDATRSRRAGSPEPVFAETERSTAAGGAAARSLLVPIRSPVIPAGTPGLSPLSPQSGAASQSTRSAHSIWARVRNAFNLNRIARVAQTRRVDESHRQSTEVAAHLDGIAGGAGDRRYDGDVAARDGVDKGRLSGVRGAGEDDREALAQTLAAMAPGEVARQFFRHVFPQYRGLFLHSSRDVGLVGEVERRLEQRQALDQPLAPALDEAAEPPLELAQGLAALRLGLGVDEVGQALDGGQVHPAVEEGAAGELARLRGAAARQAGERPQHGGAHGKTAVEVKLGLVLAGETVRTRHPDDERLVERFAGGGVAKHRERHPPRRRQAAGHGFKHAG